MPEFWQETRFLNPQDNLKIFYHSQTQRTQSPQERICVKNFLLIDQTLKITNNKQPTTNNFKHNGIDISPETGFLPLF